MQYGVLGPLEVVSGGLPLDLGRPKQRALLAALLVHAGSVVSSDRLVDILWADDPPANASAALQIQVSRLRQVLGSAGADGAAVLESRKPGYILHAGARDIDAMVFQQLVGDGDAALAAGRAAEADDRITAALALWRGAALVEFADQEFAMAEAARLEESRLHALESQAEARLARGRHAAVVGELRALAVAHPLRERIWGQLILALYRNGRQADALRAYGELRAHLAEELGIDPSPGLQRLEEAVLLQKPELDWRAPPDGEAAVGSPAEVTAVASPVFELADSEGAPFLGREGELAQLAAEWDRAATEGPRLVLVAGEPGVGKTRLTMELVRVAHRRGARVLMGRCTEELGVPFEPFAEALGRVVHQLPPDDLAALVAGRGAELIRLVPDLADLAPGLAPPAGSETEQYRLFDAVRRAVDVLAAGCPVLLVLDDLHWAAAPTVALLRHLVTRSDPMPVLVVGTYRSTEAGDLLGEARRSSRVSEIQLAGLDPAAVEGLVAALVGHDLDEAGVALARRIHHGTAGNALFVRELVRHLNESGQPFGTVEPDVPDSVRATVRRRLERLSDVANRVLQVAAVAGAAFDTRVVGAAAGLDEEAVISGLETAIDAGLVLEADSTFAMRFAHALVRAAIDDGLSAPRRAQLHRKVGEAIELVHGRRLEDHLPELAHHFVRAGDPRAVDYSARAGERALAQLAHEEAAAHFVQALALLEGAEADTVRCDLLLGLGEAQRRAGDPAHRQTLLEAAAAAQALGDADRLARAALANTRSFWSATHQVDAERVGALRAALAALDQRGEGDSSLRACLLAKLAAELVYCGDTAAVRQRSDEAVAMARRLGDLSTLAAVLAPRYNTIRGDPGTLPGRLADTAELLTVAAQVPDPALRAEAWGWRAVAAFEAGEAEEGQAAFATFDRLAAGLRQPTMRWYASYMAAGRTMYAGRFDAAAALIEEALALGQAAGQPDAGLFASAQRLFLAFERGTLERWERRLRLAVARDPASSWFFGSWQAVRACELELMDEASARWATLAADDFAGLRFEPAWLHIVVNLAAVCASVGDQRRAETLSGLLAPFAGQVVTLTSLAYGGAVDHYLGVLAACRNDTDEACRALGRAVQIAERMGAPVWAARGRLEWSRSTDDGDEAVRLARDALATAASHGALAVEAHARRRLAHLGALTTR